eukprot:c29247_g1_i1.p3 GENE.c29247_g1_i1~~c29247_g1_i1.p3  ORF type:complete len:158 (-),score=37.91 c29247_g1_i1:21-494(-)
MEYAFTGEIPAWKKNMYWFTAIVLGLFSVFSFIVAIVMGAKSNWRHLFFAGDFAVICGLFYVIAMWKKKDTGNPNIALGIVTLVVVLTCISMNMYSWQKVINPNECGSNFFFPPTGSCVARCPSDAQMAYNFDCVVQAAPPPPPSDVSPPPPPKSLL